MTAAQLEEKLGTRPLQPCGALDMLSRGWIAPSASGRLVHALNQQYLIALGVEQKLLPASIIRQEALRRAKLKEGSRNFFQVRGLCNEAANRPELFSSEDQVLLRWLSDFLPLLLTDKNRSGSPFLHDNRSLLTWLTQWGTSGRCVWEDGAAGYRSEEVLLITEDGWDAMTDYPYDPF